LERTAPEYFEFGYKEPEKINVARGKCTLRQAVQFITDHQSTPSEWTAQRIASELKMKDDNIVNVLEHFRTFSVFMPDPKQERKKILLDSHKTADVFKNLKRLPRREDP